MDAAAVAKQGDARVSVMACLAQKLALALKSARTVQQILKMGMTMLMTTIRVKIST